MQNKTLFLSVTSIDKRPIDFYEFFFNFFIVSHLENVFFGTIYNTESVSNTTVSS